MSKGDTKLDLKSLDIREDKIKKLKEVFPETVAENKVDFKKLKRVLGEEIDEGKERYGMQWPGKYDCFKIIQQQSVGTLKPTKEESVNFDETENLFIEGDNLEVLKLLQKSYYGKVKMIYIDPPYNTGNDFVYPDDFSESLETYLKYTGQVDAEGKKFTTNTETSGRFHSKWMNMMYPRLYLARNLLKKSGVIFVSIDDRELDNLKKICDEIFGESNMLAILIRKTKLTSNKGTHFSPSHEYLLAYAKNQELLPQFDDKDHQESETYLKLFKYKDDRGKFNIVSLYMPSLDVRPNQRYYIKCLDGSKVITPEGKVYRWTEETFLNNLKDNRVVFKKTKTSPLIDGDGNQAKWNIYTKIYLHERLESGLRPSTTIEKWPNSIASKELIKMGIPFQFSKPRQLTEYLMRITNTKGKDIILDFFAGSASTAHGVITQNKKDGENRKFIMVQLPEPTEEGSEAYKAGFKNIADIGKERIRRVIKKIKNEQDGQLFKKDGLDLGFKVFKLTTSNFKVWDGSSEDIKKQLELSVNHIKDGASKEDILYEILLKTSFELTTPIKEIDIAGKKVYSIEDGGMLVCLEDDITRDLIDEMVKLEPLRVVCMDSGFKNNDQLKTNAVQIMKTKDIEFRTV